MSDVDNALYNAFGQRLISTIYTRANQYRVVLEHNTEHTPGLAALDSVRLTSKDGGIVPLSAIATVEERYTPLSINHRISSRPQPFPSTCRTVTRWARRWKPSVLLKSAQLPVRHSDPVPWQHAGVPCRAGQHRLADRRGGRGDVHRAWRAVRKLYPPNHHPLPCQRRAWGRCWH